jgi:hypothetical protein
MSEGNSKPMEAIRLVFVLERDENPRLYDDLIRFKKGTKRINRLRTLSQEGLQAQHWPTGFAGQLLAVKTEAVSEATSSALDHGAVTDKVFDEPITE